MRIQGFIILFLKEIERERAVTDRFSVVTVDKEPVPREVKTCRHDS